LGGEDGGRRQAFCGCVRKGRGRLFQGTAHSRVQERLICSDKKTSPCGKSRTSQSQKNPRHSKVRTPIPERRGVLLPGKQREECRRALPKESHSNFFRGAEGTTRSDLCIERKESGPAGRRRHPYKEKEEKELGAAYRPDVNTTTRRRGADGPEGKRLLGRLGGWCLRRGRYCHKIPQYVPTLKPSSPARTPQQCLRRFFETLQRAVFGTPNTQGKTVAFGLGRSDGKGTWELAD